MSWSKAGSLTADFFRVVRNYLSSSPKRNRLREVVHEGLGTRAQRAAVRREAAAAPRSAAAFRDLTPSSLALSAIRLDAAAPRHLNVLLPELATGPFAGVSTALTVAGALADELAIPLRFVILNAGMTTGDLDTARAVLRDRLGAEAIPLVPREALPGATFGGADLWLATHWTTAHAAQVAATTGTLDASRVVYLVQDYEPDFLAASSDAALASASYHAGFVPLINSVPVWRTLVDHEGVDIPRNRVMAPQFDLAELRAAAESRVRGGATRVLFYARPSTPRNMYPLGVAVLRATAQALGDRFPIEFVSAGEKHADVALAGPHRLTSLGRLSPADYFRTLAGVDVVLSLQQSAHPSHPPFDAAISGAIAVTNDWGGTRSALHPLIRAVRADVAVLADALTEAIRDSATTGAGGYSPPRGEALGRSLSDIIADLRAVLPPDR